MRDMEEKAEKVEKVEPWLEGGDPTEGFRRQEQAKLNARRAAREQLEAEHGKGNVWDSEELRREFVVESFFAPYVLVKRKLADGQVVSGSLSFQHEPRFYFDWKED